MNAFDATDGLVDGLQFGITVGPLGKVEERADGTATGDAVLELVGAAVGMDFGSTVDSCLGTTDGA